MNAPSAREFRSSMVQVRIGGRTYDAIYEPRCNTCTHPARQLIEAEILRNQSYRAIARQFSDVSVPGVGGDAVLPEITHASIRNHFSAGHMPVGPATLRRLAEERAAAIGSDYEEAAEQFVDHYTLCQAVVHRTHERLVMGEIEPEVKDGLAAAKFLAETEALGGSGGLDAEAWGQAMTIYFENAQALMPPDMWQEFSRRLGSNPVLRAIAERMDPSASSTEEPLAIERGA